MMNLVLSKYNPLTYYLILSDIMKMKLGSIINFRLREIDMNWKHLSATLLVLTLVACEGKKEDKKAEEATPPETVKVEEPKPVAPAPVAPKEEHPVAPKEEHSGDDAHKEHHSEEKKAS
jgi:hypothetical protein